MIAKREELGRWAAATRRDAAVGGCDGGDDTAGVCIQLDDRRRTAVSVDADTDDRDSRTIRRKRERTGSSHGRRKADRELLAGRDVDDPQM